MLFKNQTFRYSTTKFTKGMFMTTLLDGKQLSLENQEQLRSKVQDFKHKYDVPPKLVAVIVGDDPASQIYVNSKAKACKAVGIDSMLIHEEASYSEEALLSLIDELNNDISVSGILVQLPLPKQINPQSIIEKIDPLKDVDGFHPYNIGRLALRKPLLRSCTPYGIMQLLNRYNIPLQGKNATIVGVSNIVGRPLALELMLAGATITSCNSKTKNLSHHIKHADIVVSATGRRDVIEEADIADHAIVVDVGMHRIDKKVCGDLNFDALNGMVSYLTPVPGGVGPMTISALLQNTYQAALMQRQNEHTDPS